MKKIAVLLITLFSFSFIRAQSICWSITNFNLSVTNTGSICTHNDSLVVSFNGPHNIDSYDFIVYRKDDNGVMIDSSNNEIFWSFQNVGGPHTAKFPWNGIVFLGNYTIPYLYGHFTTALKVISNGGYCIFPGSSFDFYLCTGLNDLSNAYFDVYPNPNNGSFEFSNLRGGEEVRIFDVVGKEILNEKSTGSTHYVNLGNASAGIYFYNVGGVIGKIVVR